MESRFKRDPNFHNKYVAFMDEYEKLDHMKQAPPSTKPESEVVYTPHHGVDKDGKIRVVFNGTAKTSTGISFNDIQLLGEKLQNSPIRFSKIQICCKSRHKENVQTNSNQ